MSNYKISTKGDFTYVTYKQKEPLQVNQREMGLFDKNTVSGFMKPCWELANEMKFVAPNGVSLKKYLLRDCSIERVYDVCLKTIRIIKEAMNRQLFLQNILFDVKYVVVREKSEELYFVYEPYIKSVANDDLFGFLLNVSKTAKIKNNIQKTELEQLKMFLSTHSSLEELETYVLSNYNRQFGRQNPYAVGGMRNMSSPINVVTNGNVIFKGSQEEGTTVLSVEEEGTTVLSQDESETTLLSIEPVFELIRSKNSTHQVYSGIECTIGRSADNTISIRDNTDISRKHAKIIYANGEFQIVDLGSKNGTTINNRHIKEKQLERLKSGDVIAFAEDEFTFIVKE